MVNVFSVKGRLKLDKVVLLHKNGKYFQGKIYLSKNLVGKKVTVVVK